jgi:hypothetical protein
MNQIILFISFIVFTHILFMVRKDLLRLRHVNGKGCSLVSWILCWPATLASEREFPTFCACPRAQKSRRVNPPNDNDSIHFACLTLLLCQIHH